MRGHVHGRATIALALAARGLRVFPLHVNSKKPAIERWEQLATRDPATIERWWTQQNYNIGIATGRADDDPDGPEWVGFDYDCKKGQQGLQTLAKHRLLGLVDTLRVRSPSNGEHAYFVRRNGTGEIKNSVKDIEAAPGVDIRGWHGYLVAPGSVVDGKVYEIIEDVAIAELPAELEKLAVSAGIDRRRGPDPETPIGELDTEAAITLAQGFLLHDAPIAIEGAGGDNTTFRVACRVKDFGVEEATCLELLLEYWNSRCAPPWDTGDLEKKVRNAYGYGREPPGSANVFEEFKDSIDPQWRRESRAEWQARTRKWRKGMDFSGWDEAAIPELKWVVMNRIPASQAGMSTGPGGAGKSIIELQRNVAHVMGTDWLGMTVTQGPTLYFGVEDDELVLQRRLMLIARHQGVSFVDLERNGLHVWPMADEDAALVTVSGKSGRVLTTDLYNELYEFCGDVKPVNVSLDTLSHVFQGNELVRTEVYGFFVHMRRLARLTGGTVTVLAHPSLAGIATGTGLSGSTAFQGAPRFLTYLRGIGKEAEAEEIGGSDLRDFEFKKNQYGELGAPLRLRYVREAGLYLPVVATEAEMEERSQLAEDVFLALLIRFQQQGLRVHPNRTSIMWAPKVFEREAEAEKYGLRIAALEAAQRRLFDQGLITIERTGRGSHEKQWLVPASANSPAN
jgi:RecA-family ATPase